MEGVARRAVLAAVASGAAVAVPGCLAGGSEGSDGTAEGSDGTDGSENQTQDAAADAGDGAAGLAGDLERALSHVYRPAGDDPNAELPLRVEHPPTLSDGQSSAGGPVDANAVEWAVGIDRQSSGPPRSVAVGEFADAEPGSEPGVEPAGQVRSLDSYEFQDWLLVVDADRLFLGDRAWIERVLDRREAGESGVYDRHAYLPDLLDAASVRQAGSGWAVVYPERWIEHLDVDPDALAYTPGSHEGEPGRAVAYRFADGYDDETVAHLRSAFTDQFDVPAVAVEEREAQVVLEATTDSG